MKKLKQILAGVLVFVGLISFIPSTTFAYVSVKGYYRSNGTYVRPHVRSNPNGIRYDNYSYKGTGSLYNKTYGTKSVTWNTSSYVTDSSYYTGKSLYQTKTSPYTTSSYYSPYSSTYLKSSLYK